MKVRRVASADWSVFRPTCGIFQRLLSIRRHGERASMKLAEIRETSQP